MKRASRSERYEQLLCLAGLTLAIELVLFKFLPDLSTALLQQRTSELADFAVFRRDYLTPGDLFYTRFLGNDIQWYLAQFIDRFFHSSDIRLHPLRIAAGILTPLYACAGAYPALRANSGLNWRYFMAAYAITIIMALYVYYPSDIPAFAALGAALFLLLQERLGSALLLMLAAGLFRETAFHVVTWVGLWMLCARAPALRERLAWVGAFAVAFAVEYVVIRHYYPGPLTSIGGVILDPQEIFLGRKTLSLTAICAVGLEVVLALACLNRLRAAPAGEWRRRFFVINCLLLPAWMIFYRMMNGNLAEFRILMPAIVPCIYGLAYATRQAAAPAGVSQSGM